MTQIKEEIEQEDGDSDLEDLEFQAFDKLLVGEEDC